MSQCFKNRIQDALATLNDIMGTPVRAPLGNDPITINELNEAQGEVEFEIREIQTAIEEIAHVRDQWSKLVERASAQERPAMVQDQDQFENTQNAAATIRLATTRARTLRQRFVQIRARLDAIVPNEEQNRQEQQNLLMQQLEAARNAAIEQTNALRAATENMAAPARQGLSLKPIKLKAFFGSKSEWAEWWPLYKVAIHDNASITKIEKLIELKGLVKDQAKLLLAGIRTIDDDNYDAAIEILKNQFNDDQSVIRQLNLDLINLKISKSFEEDQKLLVELERIVQLLKANGQEVNVPSNWLMVEQKLTKPILRQILIKKEEIGTLNWNMDQFITHFRTIVRKEEIVHEIYSQSHPKERKEEGKGKEGHNRKKPTIQASTQNVAAKCSNKAENGKNVVKKKPSKPCRFCEDSKNLHWNTECKKFHTAKARMECIKKKNLCLGCFGEGHSKSDCPNLPKYCRFCKKSGHNQALCFFQFGEKKVTEEETSDNSENEEEEEEVPQSEEEEGEEKAEVQTTAHTHTSLIRAIRRPNESESKNSSEIEKGRVIRNQKKLFYSKIIQVFNPEHPEKSAFALATFDNMSERTYIGEKLAQKLELESRIPAQVALSGFAGKNLGTFTMALTKIGIKTKKEGDKIMYPERTSKILRPINTVELDERNASELNRSKLNPPECRVPDLLIGIDYYNEFNIIRERQLPSGFWISKSIIGKILSGAGNFSRTQKTNPIISQIMSSTIEEKIVVEAQKEFPQKVGTVINLNIKLDKSKEELKILKEMSMATIEAKSFHIDIRKFSFRKRLKHNLAHSLKTNSINLNREKAKLLELKSNNRIEKKKRAETLKSMVATLTAEEVDKNEKRLAKYEQKESLPNEATLINPNINLDQEGILGCNGRIEEGIDYRQRQQPADRRPHALQRPWRQLGGTMNGRRRWNNPAPIFMDDSMD